VCMEETAKQPSLRPGRSDVQILKKDICSLETAAVEHREQTKHVPYRSAVGSYIKRFLIGSSMSAILSDFDSVEPPRSLISRFVLSREVSRQGSHNYSVDAFD
jgi:hypothetical protein